MPTTAVESAPKLTLPCPACGKWNRIRADRVTDGPKCGSCGSALRLDAPVHLNDATFDRVIAETDVAVFVDFYADWCGPCKMMAPAVDALAHEMAGRALIAKLDTEAAQRTAARFQIRGIPTCIVFRGGRETARQSGAVSLDVLRKLINNN